MIKAFKNITSVLLISLALACSSLAQPGNQFETLLAPQKDRGKKGPERPLEKPKDDRGGEKKDDRGEKKGKKP